MLINEKTWQYVRQHKNEDVRKLALQDAKDQEVDLKKALQQIAGRQTARKKLPTWADVEGVIYPPHLNMEQCSSEQTACYKRSLVSNLFPNGERGDVFVDLTGGFGIDFYWMSQDFSRRYYIEQHADLCRLAEHNFRLLDHTSTVYCGSAASYLSELPFADVIFMDPARRDEHGGRTYDIRDCTPNVLELLPTLQKKARFVILKLSPMLDWRKAVDDLQCVTQVHIVSVDNECKEMVVVLEKQEEKGECLVRCVNIMEKGLQQFDAFTASSRNVASFTSIIPISSMKFLYEPNASIMKVGCFAEVEAHYAVRQVSANSHLFLSAVEIDDFPGRKFQIEAVSSMNKKELSQKMASLKSANITVRNFPMTVDQLRKKLKLKDGGDSYIFATTVENGQHLLFVCRKIG